MWVTQRCGKRRSFLAPVGTPKAIVAKLNTEINAALIKSDLVKWGKVVKAAGIQPD